MVRRRSHLIISDPTLCGVKGRDIVCERCRKVRRFPGYIDRSYLPKHWFCEDDVWDKTQMSCEVEDVEKKHEEAKEEETALQVKMITPAIWGGETMKTVRTRVGRDG